MTLTCTNVTLRQKPLRNDRISLYLDYYPAIRNPYTMKMSRREFLGIYIYAKPKNEQHTPFIRCLYIFLPKLSFAEDKDELAAPPS